MQDEVVNWTYHVATAVRGEDRKWYVIDPNYDAPMLASEWLSMFRNKYPNGNLQLFATNPTRFSPGGGINEKPLRPQTVRDPFYNGYFVDLMSQSRAEARAVVEQRSNMADTCPPATTCYVPR